MPLHNVLGLASFNLGLIFCGLVQLISLRFHLLCEPRTLDLCGDKVKNAVQTHNKTDKFMLRIHGISLKAWNLCRKSFICWQILRIKLVGWQNQLIALWELKL